MARFKKTTKITISYIFLAIIGILMVYPLLWMISASFKTNNEIFSSIGLLPKEIMWNGYADGWRGSGQYSFSLYFSNTFMLVVPTVVFTVISSLLVAYGFARFRFRGKKVLFALVIASLMLPNEVVIIPRYMVFNSLGWLNTYLPFIIPAAFATYSFFIFMLVQYVRSIPRELDESARIDGCNSFRILYEIILPLTKPAIISVIIFQFVWRWNDFLNALIYISSVRKYPVSLALRMSLDVTDTISWNQTMAMSVLSMLPPVLLFFMAQKYFVEGISTTGLKG
ncbi:MAG: sugar ABC transporter permease [Spirochaetae bacterium HGW-Spirochaetae-2]|nr:MAG: sugar ABC transporter permease [Spirochaetae bacterium HGW-Spirochaetae-2]